MNKEGYIRTFQPISVQAYMLDHTRLDNPMRAFTMAGKLASVFVVCCWALAAGCAAQQAVMVRPAVQVSGPVSTVEQQGARTDPSYTSWQLTCPPGLWVFGIDIAGDPYITALGPLYCTSVAYSNGTDRSQEGSAGRVNEVTYLWREFGSSTGYSGIAMRLPNDTAVVEAISFVYGPGPNPDNISLSPGRPTQAYGGIGNGPTLFSSCPPGQIITGLFGTTNSFNIITVGLNCRSVVTPGSATAGGATSPSSGGVTANGPSGVGDR